MINLQTLRAAIEQTSHAWNALSRGEAGWANAGGSLTDLEQAHMILRHGPVAGTEADALDYLRDAQAQNTRLLQDLHGSHNMRALTAAASAANLLTMLLPPTDGRLPNPVAALLVADAHGMAKGPTVVRESASHGNEATTGIIVRGDECSFFPNFKRADHVASTHEAALSEEGWVKSSEADTALAFVVMTMRGKAHSKTARDIVRELGSDAPIVCPDDFLVVNDVSGKHRRSCDFYICRQSALPHGGRAATDQAVEEAMEWFGADVPPVARGVELPKPPWQRSAQIDEIWYRRHSVEGIAGRYEHPYRPSVPLYVSSGPKGWRIALPDGCIVDARGFVVP